MNRPLAVSPLAVSLVAFDGIDRDRALQTIAEAGATHVEPAYIAGTMLFTEEDFSDAAADRLRRDIGAAGLACVAVSGHMDSGVADAAERLGRRIRFAGRLGAGFLITNTARRDRRDAFLRTVAEIAPIAERSGVAIAFENPGQGTEDLLRQAADAVPLLRDIAGPAVTFNYDVGNALTNSEGAVRPETDLIAALPLARHLHLKDMVLADGAWRYTALGDGDLDYPGILARIAAHPPLPLCVELPVRQVRRQHAAPVRAEAAPSLEAVRDLVTRSVRRVRTALEAA